MTKSQMNLVAISALLLIGIGGYLLLSPDLGDEGPLPEDMEAMPEQQEKVIRFPIEEAAPSQAEPAQEEIQQTEAVPSKPAEPVPFTVTAKIPLLSESDDTLLSVMGQMLDLDKFMALFMTKDMVTRLVTTVDNMTLRTLPPKHALIKPPKGKFQVIEHENYHFTLDTRNYKRYTPYIDFMEKVNIKDAVTIYVHFYPLFQEVYESLGYPDSYFNDRLIEVIDQLLETPEVEDPIELERPNVFYIYADKELEALSAGQRTLLRMGTDNAQRLKVILINIRSEIMNRVRRS